MTARTDTEIAQALGEVQQFLGMIVPASEHTLPVLQREVDEIVERNGFGFRARAVLRRGSSGRFDKLHVVRLG